MSGRRRVKKQKIKNKKKRERKRKKRKKNSLPLLAKLPLNALTCGVILDNTYKLR